MKKFAIKSILIGFLINIIFISCQAQNYSDISIDGTKINDETNPIGIDIQAPDFSWKLLSEKRNRYQSAYQVIVLDKDTKATCWNSGKVISDNVKELPS